MAYDYDRRVVLATTSDFFEDEARAVADTLKNVKSYEKTMSQALALLRPIVECLRSKPLAKVYVSLKETVEVLPKLSSELKGLQGDFVGLESACAAEAHRIQEGSEQVSIPDVRVPRDALRKLQERIRQYNTLVTSIFDADDASFSIDELGNAGSAGLRAYERLIENVIGWEELRAPEDFLDQDVGGLAELIYDAAHS